MPRTYAFNGDADGLFALQQLRLAGASAEERSAALITGVKRDIALLGRVEAGAGDHCTALDISLDVNRAGLMALLGKGVQVRYFDHHFAGDIPQDPKLEAHIDLSPNVCTSILVDKYLGGRHRAWAVAAAFGDSLPDEGKALALAAGIADAAADRLRDLGVAVNYNAYGETIADLHVPPAELANEMIKYEDPLAFADASAAFRKLADGYRDDMAQARRLEPLRKAPGSVVFLLPDLPWARRASGTLANDLAKAHAGSAVAIVSQRTDGGHLVSVRVPREATTSAEEFCRRFPTGGGRRTAAGINNLPADAFNDFVSAFEGAFRQ
jgi:single-stranded DNA-specific DHH superfamily exonuclease